MNKKPSLLSFSLNDLNLMGELEKYKVEIKEDSTIGSLIYEHLNSKPGFIKHKRAVDMNPNLEKVYLDAIHKTVSKGAPLEIFISAFSPKVTNPNITNGHIHPDMADLLTLIHLHLVAKGIREIYDYGFRFIIGFRGSVYQDFFKWKNDDVNKSFEILYQLKDIAEKIVGIHNVVQFVDQKDLIKEQGDEFQIRLNKEINFVKNQYKNRDPFYIRKIDSWIKDFSIALDPTPFSSLDEMEKYLFEHAVYIRALKNIEYTGGKNNLGVCNRFPNILLATIRGLDGTMSFQFSPFFRFHSHQRLIVLSKDNKWTTMKWCEMESINSEFEPIYFEEFGHILYYKEK